MYTQENKGFTIITNFGCDHNCPYCITKHHPILQNTITDKSKIDWAYLEKCISESSAPTVNLSGGGDPFFNWDKNLDFYNRVYEISNAYGKKLDIHTRILPVNDLGLIKKFRKIALSIELNDDKAIDLLRDKLPLIKKYTSTKIRIINVLNERTTMDDCLRFIHQMKNLGIKQITFRQMFGNKKAYLNFNNIKNMFEYIGGISKFDGVMFLEDGEYHNYYFTTNNTLYPYFFGYTENDRKEWMKKYESIEQSCG